MVPYKLFEILSRFLKLQDEHNGLLGPITCLQQIIGLENTLVSPVRKAFVHPHGIEIPHGCPRHDEDTKGTEYSKINRGVGLFHKAVLLRPTTYAEVDCGRTYHSLHQEFARERQDNDVEAHEGKITRSFAIVLGSRWFSPNPRGNKGRIRRERIGEKYEAMERIRRGRPDKVCCEEDAHQDKGSDPSMSKREIFPSSKVAPSSPSFRSWPILSALRMALPHLQ